MNEEKERKTMQAGSELSGGLGASWPPVVEVKGVCGLNFKFGTTSGPTLDFVNTRLDGPRSVQREGPDTTIDLDGTAGTTVVVIDYEIGFPVRRRNGFPTQFSPTAADEDRGSNPENKEWQVSRDA